MAHSKQFLITNDQLDAQLNEIKNRIKLHMNGIAADAMRASGLLYQKNYGVGLPALKNMARNIHPSADLANRLWLTGWRETYILSILLHPIEKLSMQQAYSRALTAPTYEVQQLLAQQLLAHTAFATHLCTLLLDSENHTGLSVAFLLATRISPALPQSLCADLIERGILLSETTHFNLYTSISKCFGRLCRLNSATKIQLLALQTKWQYSTHKSQQCIANEIQTELDFLNEM